MNCHDSDGVARDGRRFHALRIAQPIGFAPHFTEELWCETLGNGYSVYDQKWPACDESALVKDEIEIAVQINGKVQFKVNIPAEADQAAVEAIVNADDRLAGALAGRSIVKFIYVKGRIANIVAK